jgi:hypothetical protein
MQSNQPETKLTVTRLHQEVYLAIERKFSKPVVTSMTTAHEAGFQLGVQAVLQELRHGYTIEG